MNEFSRLVMVTFLTAEDGGMQKWDPMSGLRPNFSADGKSLWMSSVWTIDGEPFQRGVPTIAILSVSEGPNLPSEWFMSGAKFQLRDPSLIATGEVLEC